MSRPPLSLAPTSRTVVRRALASIPCSVLSSTLLTAVSAAAVAAQTPDDSVSRRFRFAETFVGGDVSVLPAGNAGGGVALPGRAIPRLTIGGLHFWGHADFAVAFPVMPGVQRVNGVRTSLTTGIETRARYLPRSMARDGVSPFVGGAFSAYTLRIDAGPRVERFRPVLQAGFEARRGRALFEAGWSIRPGNRFAYPLSRTSMGTAMPSSQQLWVGVHRLIETTRPLEPVVRSGDWSAYVDRLRAAHRVSGPTFALGPTAIFLTGPSTYNTSVRPFLAPRGRTGLTIDAGAGWYFDRPDLQLNLSWRPARFNTSGYGFSQENSRNAFTLEAFHFVGDYQGFAPFIGPALSLDRLQVRERDRGTLVNDVERRLVAPGLTFGWDIRPVRAQRLVLRTNLRWFPRLRVPMPNGTQALDQLEFNFIQMVWHPRR